MPESTLLITPELTPSADTIKRGLLRAHRISVIVPDKWDGVPEVLRDHPDVWVPTMITDHMSDDTELFKSTIKEASDVVKRFPEPTSSSPKADRLVGSKLPEALQALMESKGLIWDSGTAPDTYNVSHKDLVPTVLAIFGRNIANNLKKEGWVCSFRTTINARRAIAADRSNPEGNVNAMLLELYEVPKPHPGATVSDILNFRRDNARLFDNYFRAINNVRDLLEVEVGASGDILLAINNGIAESDSALAQIQRRRGPIATTFDELRNPAILVAATSWAATVAFEAFGNGLTPAHIVPFGELVAGSVVKVRKGWSGSAYLRKATSARVIAPL